MHRLVAAIVGISLSAGLSAATTYGPGSGGPIPDAPGQNVPGAPFTSDIVVNDAFTVVRAWATIDFSHTWAGDIIATLSNGSTSITLINRPGQGGAGAGDSSNFAGAYTFIDGGADLADAADAIPGGATIPVGEYAAAGGSLNATFGGMSSAGTWTLTMTDNFALDTGEVFSWSLTLDPFPSPGAAALFCIAGVVCAVRRR